MTVDPDMDGAVGLGDEVLAPSRVLVVDDNPVNRKLLRAILASEGYVIDEAASGEEALSRVVEERPDLVLLDVVMPDLDGFDVCTRLKARPETSDFPVIFLSALTEAADKVRGLNLGAVDWITKPFHQAEVLARVRNQLQIRHLTRSLRLANADLVHKQESLREDLAAAADIQRSLIPRSAPISHPVEVAWRFTPCESVGGDIFNVLPLDEDVLSAFIVDVSGHGVPAAMVTVSVMQTLSQHAGVVVRPPRDGDITAPAEVLELLDREYPFDRFDRYFTICYTLLDTRTGELRYSSAAHPEPIVVRADGSVERLEEGGTIIGLGHVVPFEEGSVTLEPGDRIYLYTDGIVEMEAPGGAMYGTERLEALLAEAAGETLQQSCETVMDDLRRFSGGTPAADDVTLLAYQFNGPDADIDT